MTDYDSPWKEAMDAYFASFMAFFFPESHKQINWSRGYESLDKELQQVVREADIGGGSLINWSRCICKTAKSGGC